MNSGLINSGLPNPSPGVTPGVSAESSPAPASRPTLSPNPSPSRERGTVDPLELIAEGRLSVEAICIESDMSILELAAHVCTAQNIAALGRVAQLHATQREMLLGRLKRDALVRLAELTDEVPAGSADEIRAFEVMRKACTDLLRYGAPGNAHDNPRTINPSPPKRGPGGPGGPRGYPGGGYHPEPLTPAFEAEVLEALERLGEEVNEYEPRTYSETQGSPSCPPGRGRMSVPLESTPPPESTPESPPEVPPKTSETRTGKPPGPPSCPPWRGRMPIPPNFGNTPNRTPNTYNRILADDAHPP